MRNIPTELVLFEIANGLKELCANPDLSQSIKDAYALSEAEKAKSEEARAIMAQADQFMADLKKKQDALAIVNDRIAKAEAMEQINAEMIAALNKHQGELDRQEVTNNKIAQDNIDERKNLEEWKSELDERESSLKDAQEEVANIKADLKKRADMLKAQTADL